MGNLSNLLSLQHKENEGKFAASNGRLKANSFSASGGFAPLTRGSAPGPRWGLRPQTPIIGSRSRVRHKRRLFDPPLFVTFRGPWESQYYIGKRLTKKNVFRR